MGLQDLARFTHHIIDCVTDPEVNKVLEIQTQEMIEKKTLFHHINTFYSHFSSHSCSSCTCCQTLRSAGGIRWYWTYCCVTVEASGWAWLPAGIWRWGRTAGPASSQWSLFLVFHLSLKHPKSLKNVKVWGVIWSWRSFHLIWLQNKVALVDTQLFTWLLNRK